MRHLDNHPLLLALAMWWIVGGAGALVPFLPNYFASLGLSNSEVALLQAVPALTAIGMAQVWGYLADMYFRRTTLLAFQSFVCVVCASLFLYVPGHLGMLAIAYFVFSVFSGARVSMLNALVLGSHRGEVIYGPVRVAGTVGFIVMTLVLGRAMEHPGVTIAVIWLALAISEGLSVLAARRLRDLPPAERHAEGTARIGFREAQRRLLADPLIARFLLFTFFTQLGHWPAQMLMPRLLEEDAGLTAWRLAVALSVAPAAEMVVFIWGQRLLRRVPLVPLMGVAAAMVSVRFALLGLVPTFAMASITNVLHLFTFGMAYLVGVTFMNRVAPPELRSSAQTILGITFFSFPILFGNLVAWQVLQYLPLRQFYLLCGATGLLGMATLPPLVREARRRMGGSGLV